MGKTILFCDDKGYVWCMQWRFLRCNWYVEIVDWQYYHHHYHHHNICIKGSVIFLCVCNEKKNVNRCVVITFWRYSGLNTTIWITNKNTHTHTKSIRLKDLLISSSFNWGEQLRCLLCCLSDQLYKPYPPESFNISLKNNFKVLNGNFAK